MTFLESALKFYFEIHVVVNYLEDIELEFRAFRDESLLKSTGYCPGVVKTYRCRQGECLTLQDSY
jgi:hypothetical protein